MGNVVAVPAEYSGPTFEFDGERYPFEPTELMGSDVKLLKSRTGLSFPKYVADLEELGAESVGFYIWLTLTRAGKEPGKFSEFDYSYSAFLASLDGFDDAADEVEPDPTPVRPKRTSRKTSASGGR